MKKKQSQNNISQQELNERLKIKEIKNNFIDEVNQYKIQKLSKIDENKIIFNNNLKKLENSIKKSKNNSDLKNIINNFLNPKK